MEKHILLVSNFQFGYLTDDLRMCEYLCNANNRVTFFSYYQNLNEIKKFKNQKNIYTLKKNKISRIIFNLKLIFEIINKKPDIVFIRYYRGCSIIPILFKKKRIILDIRTGAVTKNKFFNKKYNNSLKNESRFFNEITIIDENLASDLNLKEYKILPLGGKRIIRKFEKNNNCFNVLYVGTFDNRNISELLRGFDLFYKKINKSNLDVNLKLVGFADNKDELSKILYELDVINNDHIHYLGRINNDDLAELYEECHVGISFIPMIPEFDNQPPTKTYEYITNGLICLATSTNANKKVINNRNGILIEDNSENVALGLEEIYMNQDKYSNIEIANLSTPYTWDNIFNKFMNEIL